MPLHKLSQWLAYSLIEPLQASGIAVSDIDGLTGLAGISQWRAVPRHGVIAFRDPGGAAVNTRGRHRSSSNGGR